jgi:HPt (histidine-containing phosphotransfer) domain-containing protein
MKDGDPIDAFVLESLRALQDEGDSDILIEICEIFFSDTPARISEMRSSLASGDNVVLQRAAHTLKSSSASLGAMKLSELSKELEMKVNSGSVEGAEAQIKKIDDEFLRVKSALTSFMKQGE